MVTCMKCEKSVAASAGALGVPVNGFHFYSMLGCQSLGSGLLAPCQCTGGVARLAGYITVSAPSVLCHGSIYTYTLVCLSRGGGGANPQVSPQNWRIIPESSSWFGYTPKWFPLNHYKWRFRIHRCWEVRHHLLWHSAVMVLDASISNHVRN